MSKSDMHITIDRNDLADLIARGTTSLPTRPPQPVLLACRLAAHDDTLTASSTDLETSSLATTACGVITEGTVLVPGRLLRDLTKSLPGGPVTLLVQDGQAHMKCGAARFKLPTLRAEDMPPLPEVPEAMAAINVEDLADIVEQVAVAAATDQTLLMLAAVLVEVNGPRVRFVATDRYRLAVHEHQWDCDESITGRLLIPAGSLRDLTKSFGAGLVEVAWTGGIASFAQPEQQATTRLITAQYPDYERLLKQGATTRATMPAGALMEAVHRVALVGAANSPVRLALRAGEVTVTAVGEGMDGTETLACEWEGGDLDVTYNPSYLVDGLKAIRDDTATMTFAGTRKPVQITGKSEDYRYLLMPQAVL